tara:strand:+ start:35 stop:169 length:135 start_codon:yes stop_codon:yes gene_type:complete
MWWFLLGLFVGGAVGFFVSAILSAGYVQELEQTIGYMQEALNDD